jgi:hypothetical protein
MTNNGFDGYQITPRFATRIYYNWLVNYLYSPIKLLMM